MKKIILTPFVLAVVLPIYAVLYCVTLFKIIIDMILHPIISIHFIVSLIKK